MHVKYTSPTVRNDTRMRIQKKYCWAERRGHLFRTCLLPSSTRSKLTAGQYAPFYKLAPLACILSRHAARTLCIRILFLITSAAVPGSIARRVAVDSFTEL